MLLSRIRDLEHTLQEMQLGHDNRSFETMEFQLENRIRELENENSKLGNIIHQMRTDMENVMVSDSPRQHRSRYENKENQGDYHALHQKLKIVLNELKACTIEKQRLIEVSNSIRASIKKPTTSNAGTQGIYHLTSF